MEHLTAEIAAAYSACRIDLDPRHIEVVVAQMLRYVRVTDPGDSGLRRGRVMDRVAFRQVNDRLGDRVTIADPGDSMYPVGKTISRSHCEQECQRLTADGQIAPVVRTPTPAVGRSLLLGISRLAARRRPGRAQSTPNLGRWLAEAAVGNLPLPLTDLHRLLVATLKSDNSARTPAAPFL